MLIASAILGSGDPWIGLAIIVIWLIVWAVKAVGSLAGGKKSPAPPAPQRPVGYPSFRATSVQRVPQRYAAPPSRPTYPRPTAPQPAATRSKLPPLSQMHRRPAPPPLPSRPSAALTKAARAQVVASSVEKPRNEMPAKSTSPLALARWLAPSTLRSQFILAEALQPPLALRRPRI